MHTPLRLSSGQRMKALESSLQYCWLDVLAAMPFTLDVFCLAALLGLMIFYLCFLLVVLMPVSSHVKHRWRHVKGLMQLQVVSI